MKELRLLGKTDLLRQTVRNWPLVLLDKSGLMKRCRYRLRDGSEMVCRGRSADIDVTVALCSGYEYPDFALVAPDEAVVIDAGANIGAFVARLMALNGDRNMTVHAFEPYPENFRLLEENISRNGWANVHAHRAAIAGVPGNVHLQIARRLDGVRISREATGVTAPAFTVSDFCARMNLDSIDLLKLDIEGSEHDVIEHDYDVIASRVKTVVLEYHVANGRGRDAIVDRVGEDFMVDEIWRRERDGSGVLVLRNRTGLVQPSADSYSSTSAA